MVPLWPKFRAIVPIICLISVIRASDNTKPGFSFDLNAGTELQQSVAEKAAPDVSFTDEAGGPYAMPYDAQRIGSDGGFSMLGFVRSNIRGADGGNDIGPLLLQDVHLIESLAHFARERIPERWVDARSSRERISNETS